MAEIYERDHLPGECRVVRDRSHISYLSLISYLKNLSRLFFIDSFHFMFYFLKLPSGVTFIYIFHIAYLSCVICQYCRLTSTERRFPGGGGCLPWTGGSPGVWTGSTTRWTASGSTPSSGPRRRRSSSSLTGRLQSERLCRRRICWCSRPGRAGLHSVSSWAGRSPALPSLG